MGEKVEPIYHGGALDVAMTKYGGNRDIWLDLSTGINPHFYPVEKVPLHAWTQLPQQAEMDNLLNAAAANYGCSQMNIAAANGTQKLIEILPKIFAKSTIAIYAPTYEEHAQNWRQNGHNVVLIDNLNDALNADHLLIVNPNNPSGRLFEPQELTKIHKHFAAKNGFLIIDEAFMDMTPQQSMAPQAGEKGLIILRSFGKFFGLAGVRIGFMLAQHQVLQKVQAQIGLWEVAGMSLNIAKTALEDHAWQENMRQTLALSMLGMRKILQQNGFGLKGGTNLFCLVEMPDKSKSAHKYFDILVSRHILVRKFVDDTRILRFGLPKASQQYEFAKKLALTCAELGA